MPRYEYRCVECENQYETREGFDAPPTQACPKCGGRARRVYSAPPIVFKGSGFYVTDSRKGSSATVSSSSGEEGGSSSSTAAAAPATAPATSEPATAAKSAASED